MFAECDESQSVLNATYYRILWAGHMLVFSCFFSLHINVHPKSQGISHPLLKNPGETGKQRRSGSPGWIKAIRTAPSQGRASPARPVSVATQKPSVGQQLSAAPWLLSVLPDHLRVRVSDCPSAAHRVTDSFLTERSRLPRHFRVLAHFAPQPGQGPLLAPGSGTLAVSEQERCGTGCCCTAGSRKQRPRLGRPIALFAPDTSLVMEPSAKDRVQSLDSFLPCRKASATSSRARQSEVCKGHGARARPRVQRHHLQLPPCIHGAKLLRGTGVLLQTTAYSPHDPEKPSCCP